LKPVLTREQLCARRCAAQESNRGHQPDEIAAQLAELGQWQLRDGAIERVFGFANFHEVMDFVNAVAAMVHGEDHHPDIALGYNRCTIRWNTHSVGGISDNDFICAAKTDAIFAP
jgi:4a-hydroxytetrahydrobiopterin dehydratase